MKNINHCISSVISIAEFMMFLLLINVITVYAAENQESEIDKSASFEVNAPIMKIDLDNNLMVIAEKNVYLKYSVHEGKKQWQTEFLDAKGQAITVTVFKVRDRVIADGTMMSSGKILADKISLIAAGEVQKKDTLPQESGSSSGQTSSPQLIDGVWKN